MTITSFVKHHFRHFNAATVVDAAEAWNGLLSGGGKMFLTMAGAMSTAEIGLSLAEMIRQDKVHAITCTGANLEEDVFNLVAHDHYVRIPHYRQLTPAEEEALHGKHLNRVTDTCIPEEEAIRRIEKAVLEEWQAADRAGERRFPHEFLYRILLSGKLKESYQIDPKDSWLLAAAQKNLPIFVPGWEDSTLGNIFAAHCIEGDVKNVHTVQDGHRVHAVPRRVVHEDGAEDARSASSRSAAASRATSRSASSRCSTRTCAARASPSGRTSARSATRRRATGATPAPSRTRRSRGASSRETRRSSSSSRTPRSWPRSSSRMVLGW